MYGVALSDYRPRDGDHLCSVWTDPPRDRSAAARFLRGAGEREAALWVQDPSRVDVPVEEDAAAGAARLATHSTRDVHLAGGTFDPARMHRFWTDRSQEARARGATHLRAVAEMAWALEERPGTEHAGVFESSLNPLLESLPMSVICQYGSTRFRPETVLAMLLSHPLVVIGDRIFSNPYFVPHEEFPPRMARLGDDAVGSLTPIWRHFLHRLPTSWEVAAFLCNSLPAFIPASQVTITGLHAGLTLDVAADRLRDEDPSLPPAQTSNRLFAVWASSQGVVGGAVHLGGAGSEYVLEATYEGSQTTLVLIRPRAFSGDEVMRFTALATAVGTVLAEDARGRIGDASSAEA